MRQELAGLHKKDFPPALFSPRQVRFQRPVGFTASNRSLFGWAFQNTPPLGLRHSGTASDLLKPLDARLVRKHQQPIKLVSELYVAVLWRTESNGVSASRRESAMTESSLADKPVEQLHHRRPRNRPSIVDQPAYAAIVRRTLDNHGIGIDRILHPEFAAGFSRKG